MRYRHAWPGFLLLGALAVLLVALVLWGDHFLTPGPSGGLSRLLERAASGVGEPGPSAIAPMEARAATSAVPDVGAVASAPPVAGEDGGAPRRAAVGVERRPAVQPAVRPGTGASAPVRYALDLGTFPLAAEAEQAEAQLNQAGFSTVRFQRQEPARLYSVYLPLPSDPEEARAALERLRQDGFAVVLGQPADGPLPAAVLIARAMPLRTAVRVADRLRGVGQNPRVTADASRDGQVTLRHGSFATREEAAAVGRELARLGVSAEIVRIR